MHIVPRYVGDLENPGDWYQELEKAEKHIDSIKRKKLSSSEMGKIVTNLQRVALNMSDEFYML